MDFNQNNMKKIKELILFTAIVILALIKFDFLWTSAAFILKVIKPFLIGGMIAFVINIPMRFIETKLLGAEPFDYEKEQRNGKLINYEKQPATRKPPRTGKQLANERKRNGKQLTTGRKLIIGRIPVVQNQPSDFLQKGKRGLSLLAALLFVISVITLIVVTVIPQFVDTIKELTNRIPVFWDNVMKELEVIFASNPEFMQRITYIETLEIDWQSMIDTAIGFLRNGMGNMLDSTFSAAGSIISSVVNFFISFVFSIYILIQKEKLGIQFTKLLKSYTRPSIAEKVLKVCRLLYQNFSHFITGQCTEAVILGLLFVIAMITFQFDYAVTVGGLIAFTSLIPIVGAFIGCFIGAFMMLVDDPVKAFWFIILFIILQQIEGNLIYPQVVGNSVGLPSIWVLAAVTIGGSLMGVFGMLIFIPLLSTVYMLLRDDVNRRIDTQIDRQEKL